MKKFFIPFINALKGIFFCFLSEKNFRFHIFCVILVIIFSFLLKIERMEWIFILTAIFIVVITEMINTSIEKTLDMIDSQYNEKIKIIKDISAGFVFLASVYAIIVGFIVFFPRVFNIVFGLKR